MRKKKQEKVNPTEIEIALPSVLQPRFSRLTNDLGFYSAWIAYVVIISKKCWVSFLCKSSLLNQYVVGKQKKKAWKTFFKFRIFFLNTHLATMPKNTLGRNIVIMIRLSAE